MESPFYGNYRSLPRYSSNYRGIPVQPLHQNPVPNKPAPKVVQIPVHFVDSDSGRSGSRVNVQKSELNRSASALKIQKVFKGFLVRKYVKKIVSIRKEVDEIERKLLCRETAELIRRNERERLRVNETLMSLLLKLDSIRGIDSGVRDCRKAVIKKAISLQEKIDSIVSAGSEIAAEEENRFHDSDKLPSTENHEECGKSTDLDEVPDEKTELEASDDVAPAVVKSEEATDWEEVSGAAPNCTMNDEKTEFEGRDDVEKILEESQECPIDEEKAHMEAGDDVAPVVEKSEEMLEESLECPMNEENSHMEGGDNVARDVSKSEEMQEESKDCAMNECVTEEGIEGGGWVRVDDDDEKKRNRELLEKMVEENGKMMRMMNELCKRNEVQTKMLNSLTQRVDQLEKAFVSDRLKNKKKKRNTAN